MFCTMNVHHDADNGGQAYEQVVASIPDWAYEASCKHLTESKRVVILRQQTTLG